MAGRKGCVRSALECCKLLLALDPRDPQGARFQLDFFALRSGQLEWLLRFLPQHREGGLMSLPSSVYSHALATLFLRQAVDGGERKDPEQLEQAQAALAGTTGVEGTMRHALLLHPAARTHASRSRIAPGRLQLLPLLVSEGPFQRWISRSSFPVGASEAHGKALRGQRRVRRRGVAADPGPQTVQGEPRFSLGSAALRRHCCFLSSCCFLCGLLEGTNEPPDSLASRRVAVSCHVASSRLQGSSCNDCASLEHLVEIFVERHHSLYRPAAVNSHLKRCAAAAAAEADGAAPGGAGSIRDWAAVREEVFPPSDSNRCPFVRQVPLLACLLRPFSALLLLDTHLDRLPIENGSA